jgi:small subunit ribosomal protein S6
MTRQYELVYIFDSALEETQINERLDRFHSLLISPEAPEPVTSTNHWGKRSLAYSIQGKAIGYYVVVQFKTQPDVLGELERQLKLDESVLRYLIVLNEGPAPMPPRVDEGPAAKKAAEGQGATDQKAADEKPADAASVSAPAAEVEAEKAEEGK